MKKTRDKHDVIVGESKDFNLENSFAMGKFNVFVNGSIQRSYEKLYDHSKSQNANIAVIEKRDTDSIKGTLYSAPGNPFGSIRDGAKLDYTSNKYTLLNM